MLNVRKKKKKLATLNEKTCEKHLASLLTDYFEQVNENLALFKMHIPQLVLDIPIFGQSTVIRSKVTIVISNFEIHAAIPDSLIDAIGARFNCYQFDIRTGYKVRHLNEHAASDRVLRVLHHNEPDLFVREGLVQLEMSTLSAEIHAWTANEEEYVTAGAGFEPGKFSIKLEV